MLNRMSTGERAWTGHHWPAIGLLPLAAAFGAAVQYLGTPHLPAGYHPVASTISGLSAPWLPLAFCFGWTQVRPRPAALIGLAATMAGLAGYFAMMWSPVEGVHMRLATIAHLVIRSQAGNVLGDIVTGPLYGWLGQIWRTRRSLLSALLAAGPLTLEPAALAMAGRAWGSPPAYAAKPLREFCWPPTSSRR